MCDTASVAAFGSRRKSPGTESDGGCWVRGPGQAPLCTAQDPRTRARGHLSGVGHQRVRWGQLAPGGGHRTSFATEISRKGGRRSLDLSGDQTWARVWFHEALKGRAGAGGDAGPRCAGALLCDGPAPLYLGARRQVPLLAATSRPPGSCPLEARRGQVAAGSRTLYL